MPEGGKHKKDFYERRFDTRKTIIIMAEASRRKKVGSMGHVDFRLLRATLSFTFSIDLRASQMLN